MISSVLVIEPDVEVKFDRSSYGKFFSNYGVNQTVFLGKDCFLKADKAPLCDLLLIAYQSIHSDERKRVIKTLGDIYETHNRPILQVPQKEVVSISEEFLVMAFGDSLTLLKDKRIPSRAKALYVLVRFFAQESFQRSSYVQRLKQLTKDIPDNHISSLIQNFVVRGYLKVKNRGVYSFCGLDEKTYLKLESLGFDMDRKMVAPGSRSKTVEKTPVPAASPAALPAPKPAPAAAPTNDFDTLVRQEFAQLREELIKKMQEQVHQALVAQKINDKLLNLPPKALEKAGMLLDLLSSP